MARKKFDTLTEQMFYILIALKEERCGIDVAEHILTMTEGRMRIGPGTLYTLLGEFERNNLIQETAVEGRKRSYRITKHGMDLITNEYERIKQQVDDYERYF